MEDFTFQNTEKATLVTVVTVCFNAETHIEKTVCSVVNQIFPTFEYLVIDGQSSDRTIQKIRKYKERIDVIISEPDAGIYDAMNKAIDLAKGEWIIFMNAGDWFVDEMVLSDIFSNYDREADFLYGNNDFFDGSSIVHVPVRPLSKMWQRISFSHQALFSKTILMKQYKFDLGKPITADYDFYFRCYAKGHRFVYIDRTVSVVLGGGFSSLSFSKRTWQRWRTVAAVTPSIKVHLYYIALFLWNPLPILVKQYLKRIIKRLRDF